LEEPRGDEPEEPAVVLPADLAATSAKSSRNSAIRAGSAAKRALAAKARVVAAPVKVQKKAPTKLDQKAEDFWGALQEEDNEIEAHAIDMEAKENMLRQQGGVFAMRR